MAYTPQEWRDGDEGTPLSADRLIHMEAGIGGAHDDIAGKADASAIPDVSGLATKSEVSSALADKADAAHTHTIANVTGLQAALDGKQAKGDYASAAELADLVARVEALEAG